VGNDDYNAGLRAGESGSVFGPTSAAGNAGFAAGQALAANRGKTEGSLEWLLAPVVLAPFAAIFYPVATVAGLSVAFVVEAIANAAGLDSNSLLRWTLIVVATVATFWPLCRMDQQWGLNRRYYLARHAVRLAIFALLANGAAQNGAATAANLPVMAPMTAMFAMPPKWLPVCLMLAFWQLFFMRAVSFRAYWNKKLKSWRLRPADFDAFYFTWGRKPLPYTPQTPIPMPGRARRSTQE
jgi:hypothetical protein